MAICTDVQVTDSNVTNCISQNIVEVWKYIMWASDNNYTNVRGLWVGIWWRIEYYCSNETLRLGSPNLLYTYDTKANPMIMQRAENIVIFFKSLF